ncbi:MAG: DUF2283 domain-containing protein [Rhodobacteraceae bacterium]|nr:DUF2283 domain-containing protein [Paracoccaceae bacterium]
MAILDVDKKYDEEGDVLYLTIQSGVPGIAEESLPGVLWRYSPNTKALVGITILEFSDYWMEQLDELIQELDNRLHIGKRKAKLWLSLD